MSGTRPQTRPGDQWLRWCSLRVGPKAGGDAVDLSELRIWFHVTNPIVSTPGALKARIYNLSPSTVGSLLQFNPPSMVAGAAASGAVLGSGSGQVILDAGYQNGQRGNLFHGEIVQVRAGRENQTDTYVDIYGQDGDFAITAASINTTLGRGYTHEDQRQAIASAMGVPGDSLDPSIAQGRAPRGKPIYGMARDHASDLARTLSSTWSVDKGQLQFLPYDRTRGGDEAIVINAATGMIGMPELTQEGVVVRCLLNPAIGWGTRIQIDNRVLTQQNPGGPALNLPAFQQGITGQTQNFLPGTSADGLYKVIMYSHVGDTRGNEWYSDITALSLDPTAALPLVVPQAVGGIP